MVVQLSLRCSRAWQRLNVMVGSDSEASEVACLASWSTQSFPGMSLCPGHHAVTPYKCLGKISDILHLNNKNNQLERRVRPPKDIH